MTESTILRHEALKAIDTGEPFSLVFITADRHRGTGGDIKEVKDWVKVKGDSTNIRIPGKQLSKKKVDELRKSPGIKAFNIYNPDNPADHIMKVHYRLMIFFNGKRIID